MSSVRRLPLTPLNRRQRLEWCRARSTWMTEWHRVVFSDESRFCLSSDSRRVRVWRRRGERSNPAAFVERPTARQRGIMAWSAIAYDIRSTLVLIQGTMTSQRYVDDVLRSTTLPYLQGVPNALYQQDNARPYTARLSQQPRSKDELWQMVGREWRAIPQDAIRSPIDSLSRRVAACLKLTPDEIKDQIYKLAKKGLTPSQIGVILRDSHGVAQVRWATGSKILRILKAKGLNPDLPEDLYHLIKKAVAIRKHLEKNRKDKDSKFRLILVESRIHRLARYYKTTKVLDTPWKYESSTASALVA
ncbi:RPS13 [Cordylochernes scorpioides]|uniref:Small ribosomal subunit protein uS15 n=1 Tax=Cordylochernes scorpioides TaxID=51811 RepID=A0ABY6LIL5_9ARAC|nr:RPS13 [Cordylochernes scorpioides]